MFDLQGVPALVAAARPSRGPPPRQADNPNEWATESQAPRKEAWRSAYAAEQARPYPLALDRITSYEETPPPGASPPSNATPPPPTHGGSVLRAIRATYTSTV